MENSHHPAAIVETSDRSWPSGGAPPEGTLGWRRFQVLDQNRVHFHHLELLHTIRSKQYQESAAAAEFRAEIELREESPPSFSVKKSLRKTPSTDRRRGSICSLQSKSKSTPFSNPLSSLSFAPLGSSSRSALVPDLQSFLNQDPSFQSKFIGMKRPGRF